MSAAATRMGRPEAIAIARAFVDELEGTYDDLRIAGSLRRKLALVGDVEVCAIPRVEIERSETLGLFGSEFSSRPADRLHERLNAMLEDGRVTKRPKSDGTFVFGPKAKLLVFQDAAVDVYCAVNDWNKEPAEAEPDRFGWLLLLRTGPAAFTRQLVVPTRDDRGKVGRTKDGRPGLMPPHLVFEGGWLRYRTSREKIATPDEQSIFELFSLPWREPWERE